VIEENHPRIADSAGEGFVGYEIARQEEGNKPKYVTITRFDSWEAVENFAGEDYTEAYVPPAAQELLIDYDETVDHDEVRHHESL